jgi:hypothetical protein
MLSPEALIVRAHNAALLQFAHVLVLLVTALLVVAAVHLMKLLEDTSWRWAGLAGAAMGVLGAILLAADKGALCLTMTALDTVPADKFTAMMPGLIAVFSMKGSMWLLWGMALLSVGFGLLAVGLLRTRVIPRWQSALFLVGVLFVGFPDGAEIINLTAAVLMAVGMVPYGIRLVTGQSAEPAALPDGRVADGSPVPA